MKSSGRCNWKLNASPHRLNCKKRNNVTPRSMRREAKHNSYRCMQSSMMAGEALALMAGFGEVGLKFNSDKPRGHALAAKATLPAVRLEALVASAALCWD